MLTVIQQIITNNKRKGNEYSYRKQKGKKSHFGAADVPTYARPTSGLLGLFRSSVLGSERSPGEGNGYPL